MLMDFLYHHQSASEVSPHCTHRWRKNGVQKTNPPKIRVEKSNSQPIPSTNLFVCLIGSQGYLGNVTLDTGKNAAACLFEEAASLDFLLFFLDLHPKSISPKKNSS